MTQNSMKIGMGQLLVEGGEPQRNLQRAGVMIREAKNKECAIILLPECLDLAWTHPSAKTEAKPIHTVTSGLNLTIHWRVFTILLSSARPALAISSGVHMKAKRWSDAL
ncbi:MAG: hypothetical protein ABIJ41_06700 [Candidatus Omnitrophota bacterium]